MDEAPFEIVRRGYDPQQVRSHLESLQYDLRIALADRRLSSARVDELMEQLTQARSQAEQLREELDRDALAPLTLDGLTGKMQRVVELAREESDRILAAAHEESERQRARAAADCDRLRAETAAECSQLRDAAAAEAAAARVEADLARGRLDEERAEFHTEQERARKDLADEIAARIAQAQQEATHTLETARAGAAAELAAAERDIAALTAAADTARREQDEDFELAISERRTAAYAELERLRAESAVEAARRLDLSATHARAVVDAARQVTEAMLARTAAEVQRRLAAADDEVDRMRGLRERIRSQVVTLRTDLGAVADDIDRSLERMAALTGEHEPRGTADAISAVRSEVDWRPPDPPAELAALLDDGPAGPADTGATGEPGHAGGTDLTDRPAAG